MAKQYKAEYDPETKQTRYVIVEDGQETGTYNPGTGASPTGVNNQVMGYSSTADSEEEVIGAGPNAGLTQSEVDARDSAYKEETGRNYYDDFPTPDKQIARSNRYYVQTSSAQKLLDAQKREAEKKKTMQKDQTSALTSYSYNPETISGSKKAGENFKLSVDDIMANPWDQPTKDSKIKTQLEITANDLSKYWTDPESFLKDFTSNPDIQKNLQGFLNAGGTKEQILEKINKNTAQYLPDTGEMTTDEYLANMTTEEKTGYMKAVESLANEKDLTQDRIAKLTGMPEDTKKLYFGTEEEMGIWEAKLIEANKAIELLEQKALDAKTTTEEKAKFQIEKARQELSSTKATIEKNRLSAKNYMTGMLAKLGALNTTSSAPIALEELDFRYQELAQKAEMTANNNIKAIEIDLADDLNKIDSNLADKKLSISEDLTKTRDEIVKEITKAENDAEKEIFSLTNTYYSKFRTAVDKYTAQAKAEAEKYAKEFAKIVSNNLDIKQLSDSLNGKIESGEVQEGEYVVNGKEKGILQPDGTIKAFSLTTTQAQTVAGAKIVGEDTIKYFLTLPTEFKNEWQRMVSDKDQRYSYKALKTAYEEWKKKKDSEKKTTGSSTSFEEAFGVNE